MSKEAMKLYNINVKYLILYVGVLLILTYVFGNWISYLLEDLLWNGSSLIVNLFSVW